MSDYLRAASIVWIAKRIDSPKYPVIIMGKSDWSLDVLDSDLNRRVKSDQKSVYPSLDKADLHLPVCGNLGRQRNCAR